MLTRGKPILNGVLLFYLLLHICAMVLLFTALLLGLVLIIGMLMSRLLGTNRCIDRRIPVTDSTINEKLHYRVSSTLVQSTSLIPPIFDKLPHHPTDYNRQLETDTTNYGGELQKLLP